MYLQPGLGFPERLQQLLLHVVLVAADAAAILVVMYPQQLLKLLVALQCRIVLGTPAVLPKLPTVAELYSACYTRCNNKRYRCRSIQVERAVELLEQRFAHLHVAVVSRQMNNVPTKLTQCTTRNTTGHMVAK